MRHDRIQLAHQILLRQQATDDANVLQSGLHQLLVSRLHELIHAVEHVHEHLATLRLVSMVTQHRSQRQHGSRLHVRRLRGQAGREESDELGKRGVALRTVLTLVGEC